MCKRFLCAALLTCCLAGGALAQDELKRDPGYVDLDAVESWFSAEPKIIVNVKGALLKLVAEASRYEDPELADLLGKLKSVQVRSFNLRRADYRSIEQRTGELARRLEGQGWDTVVRVREDDERVDVFVRVHNGVIAGMMVMAVTPDEDETFFVNIVGQIDPEQIGRIGRKFDIHPLDGMSLDY